MPSPPINPASSAAPAATTLATILAQFRDDARSNRDLGDRFERLMLGYFQMDPIYTDRFSAVWLWNDWPEKGRVGDVGIDIVARERATGGYCAIQCKFYLPEHTIDKNDLDSFFTAAGRDPITSGMVVSTTDLWGKNAEDALKQSKPITRLSLHDLDASPIDWSKFDHRRPQLLARRTKKQLRPHQEAALAAVVTGLKQADRGKLIMACGTGKTFTALRIAERIAPCGHVLFLVPSLSLLAQSLREWTSESQESIHCLAVCSDANIGKSTKKGDDDRVDITVHDLAFPATTSARQLLAQYEALTKTSGREQATRKMTVVFSTYQSIEAVVRAQKTGLPNFDLIVCDEAHRTTGVTLSGEDESHFVKVHDPRFLRGTKRLYMTATSRIYGDEAKGRAKEANAELCSMDDAQHFGEELHRLGFGEAVGKSLLSDYKVLVLAVDEKYISRTFQRQIADANNELNLDDAVKITGCWNGLAKRFENLAEAQVDLQGDTGPMRRAVAFSRSIKDSRSFVQQFAQITAAYHETHPDDDGLVECEADHVDGTFNALRRGALLDWLKADSPEGTCRILSNARCLSEGVDVPSLDAVLFLNPRNSVIDVVQSVGRVMRRADNKKYGYIILPVGIPADVQPEEALKDNDKYRVVWQVLQALRAHDDRFNATINQLELNERRPPNIQVIGVGGPDGGADSNGATQTKLVQGALAFRHLDAWRDAIYGKIVLKCGDRRYWESWAKDVATIAERHTTRIKALLDKKEGRHAKAFDEFLAGLQHNLNPGVTRDDAIEMLSQHLITRPVFDALFEGYAFTKHNPVSVSMQRMLDTLQDETLEKEAAALEKFYASVRTRASGIDNAEGRQRVVVELYDKFFRSAFPQMTQRLGIVYTPIEVVDFIVASVENLLQEEFGSSISDEHVHVIDPFTGTGTFIARLLQSGLIRQADLLRKYRGELHANEIVLLAYYIAAINIEESFHSLRGADHEGYLPFEGVVLTDTFQLYEPRGELLDKMFPENNLRVAKQKISQIRVVVANPPYSAQQESENDNNKNLVYPHLDQRIRDSYVARSQSKLAKNAYDSYIRAIRWAGERIGDRGVVGYVTNASFIDGNNMDGLRACLAEDFTSMYVFHLRGNQRTSGETSRQEGGKIFGSGSRAPIAITLFVRNPTKSGSFELRYHDIGDYLTREQKLAIIKGFGSVAGIREAGKWTQLRPNERHDWINQRDPAFGRFIALGDKDGGTDVTVFSTYSLGVVTNRDAWVYNMSRPRLRASVRGLIEAYTSEVQRYSKACRHLSKSERPSLESVVDMDSKRISWTRALKADAVNDKELTFSESSIVESAYRPFTKQWLYFNRRLNEMVYKIPTLFPTPSHNNVVIVVSGVGASKDFSALVTDRVPNLHMHDTGQCFPLFLYEKPDAYKPGLDWEDDQDAVDGYRRRSAITDAILKRFRDAYERKVGKEDIFYYVYGLLHSPEYRNRFAADLKKMLPRIPLTQHAADFWRFSQAGRDLASWHLGYEAVEPYPLSEHSDQLVLDPSKHYLVTKMVFGRKDKKVDKSVIHFNSRVTLSGIPLQAYEYVVNGKSAVEWIMERYEVARDKDSSISNDPNDWSKEHKQDRYIIDLLRRIVRVSIESRKIIDSLPALNERV